ncbi:hypothetical protein Dimus_026736, partial [Dionaea muscipula]
MEMRERVGGASAAGCTVVGVGWWTSAEATVREMEEEMNKVVGVAGVDLGLQMEMKSQGDGGRDELGRR